MKTFKQIIDENEKVRLSEASLKFELDSDPGAWHSAATFQMINPDSPLMKFIKNPKKLKTIETYGLLHQVSLSAPEYNGMKENGWLGVFFATYWTGKNQKDDIIYKGYHKSYKEMISKTEKALKKYTKGKWDLRKAPTEEELMKGDLKNRHTNSAN